MTAPPPHGSDVADLLPWLRSRAQDLLPEYLELLARAVGIDSGSRDAAGVRGVADVVVPALLASGCSVERLPVRESGAGGATAGGGSEPGDIGLGDTDFGDVLLARLALPVPVRVLVVGHLDTVFDRGTARQRPFHVRDGVARGPGVSDDKGGVLAAVLAARLLAALPDHRVGGGDDRNSGELVLAFVPDEEIGSPGSSPVLQRLAREADLGLCVECAREDGSIVTARKGAVDLVYDITGRSAHAGIEPERGVDASVVAARLVLALQELRDVAPGVSVNVGYVRAGSRPNVIAASARVVADARSTTTASFHAVVERAERLAEEASTGGARVDLTVRAPALPLTPGPVATALADRYGRLAAVLGLHVTAVATGGVADANLLAATGLPVLDGLGPVGGDDHSEAEWLRLDSVPDRVALLAALVLEAPHLLAEAGQGSDVRVGSADH